MTSAPRVEEIVNRATLAQRDRAHLDVSTEGVPPKSAAPSPAVSSSNPFTNEHVPVYVADYVLGNYGTGAIMAVPGEDERDFEFATVHGLPIVRNGAATRGLRRRRLQRRRARTSTRASSTASMSPTRRPRPRSISWSTPTASRRSTIACATGWCRANVSGVVRSPSSTATTTGLCPCPSSNFPSSLPMTSRWT